MEEGLTVYKDIVTNDEMISSSYITQKLFDDAIFMAEGKLVIKGEVDCGVAANADEDDEAKVDVPGEVPKGETVIDIVDHFGLSETSHDLKSFEAYLKGKKRL